VTRRVVITSVVRYAVPTEMSGWLRVLDLATGETNFKTLVPESVWRRHDPNPRGGTRGTRGVSVHGERLVIAGADRLYVFDTHWRLVGELTHRLMGDVHDVLAEERGIWVASTGCDALLLYDWDGELLETWPLREDERLMAELGRPGHWLPLLEPDVDYRDPRARNVFDAMHLNGLAHGNGVLLLSLGRVTTREEDAGRAGSSAIVRFDGVGFEVLYRRAGVVVPNHNVAEADDRLLFNDSNRHCVVVHDRRTNTEVGAVSIPGDPPFVRGLARVEPDLWLVGSQAPLAVYAVDAERARRVAEYRLDGVEHEAVYGISVLPETFATPQRLHDPDPYAFWKRAALPPTVTPIPGLTA